MIRLVPMTPAELDDFLATSIPRYAEESVRSGRWTREIALDSSRTEHERLLPQGVATPDQYLRTIRDAGTGERVGELWYAHRSEAGPKQVWIFWIGIDPAHRRHGYAQDALRALEAETRRLGSDRLGLHVFAFNSGARALYDRMGFEATNVVMWKTVRPEPGARSEPSR